MNEQTKSTSPFAILGLFISLLWYVSFIAILLFVVTYKPSGQEGLALAVFVGAVCMFGWIPFCFAAMVFNIVALYRINKSEGRLSGKKIAIASILLSIMSCSISFSVLFLLFY